MLSPPRPAGGFHTFCSFMGGCALRCPVPGEGSELILIFVTVCLDDED